MEDKRRRKIRKLNRLRADSKASRRDRKIAESHLHRLEDNQQVDEEAATSSDSEDDNRMKLERSEKRERPADEQIWSQLAGSGRLQTDMSGDSKRLGANTTWKMESRRHPEEIVKEMKMSRKSDGIVDLSEPFLPCMPTSELVCLDSQTTLDLLEGRRSSETFTEAPEVRLQKVYETAQPCHMLRGSHRSITSATLHALLGKNELVIAQSPIPSSLSVTLDAIGARVIEWRPKVVSERYKWEVTEQLVQLMNAAAPALYPLAVIFSSPHLASGATLKQSEVEEVVAVCDSFDAHAICDETMRFTERDERWRPKSVCDLSVRGVAIMGGGGALRLGEGGLSWAVCRNCDILRRIEAVLSLSGGSTFNKLSVNQAALGLSTWPLQCERTLSALREGDEALMRHGKGRWARPDAGACAFVNVNEGVCERLLNCFGICCAPSEIISNASGQMRINLAASNVDAALSAWSGAEERLGPDLGVVSPWRG